MTRLGAIADDLTGATDLAIALTAAGYRTAVVAGADDTPEVTDADAIVLALKSRNEPADVAVAGSLRALEVLQSLGCERFYFKYCSTFDSTPAGNIGPVGEALVTALNAPGTIYCPSFPANGRTVYQGHLFVGADRLDESPMRHHPLNPMTDSSLVRWLDAQTEERVGLVPLPVVREGRSAIRDAVGQLFDDGVRHVVIDAVVDADVIAVAEATAHLPLVTGGSALAFGFEGPRISAAATTTAPGPHRYVLSGSASHATQGQVRHGIEAGTGIKLDPVRLAAEFDATVDEIMAELLGADAAPVVVYATATPDDVRDTGNADVLEQALGELARRLVEEAGVCALVVAGGETSGSVVQALGVSHLYIGAELDPGVAWARGIRPGRDDVMLVLKSGNFGSADLFSRAWKRLA